MIVFSVACCLFEFCGWRIAFGCIVFVFIFVAFACVVGGCFAGCKLPGAFDWFGRRQVGCGWLVVLEYRCFVGCFAAFLVV